MSNVKLSAAELALACNADILLTKNSVVSKVYDLFGHLSQSFLQQANQFSLPAEVLKTSPKISRGENYHGLPWVMLDYPRLFSGNDIFSVRTMFWWGNYFSQFILLKGEMIPAGVSQRIVDQLSGDQHFLCTGTDPWQHHFTETNMAVISQQSQQEINSQVAQSGFLKLGTKIPIERWESVENFMTASFDTFLKIAT
ncbi:MAG: hypothetical protein V4722_17430 [Bacteroidota bacterium]